SVECDKPDVQIGVGPRDVMELVNVQGAIWTRDGRLRSVFPLGALFRAPTKDLTDPQLLYDPVARRWIASVLDRSHDSIKLAVSPSSDPRLPWRPAQTYRYRTACPDIPRLGSANKIVVLTATLLVSCESGQALGGLVLLV